MKQQRGVILIILKLELKGGNEMSENKKQTELEQLIKVELLGIITRIAELAAKNIIDANQQEFINSLKSVINHQIAFAWEVTKLLNDLDKKTPQEFNQEELIKLCSPIIEFLKKQPHPYHTILIKEESVELLETKTRSSQL